MLYRGPVLRTILKELSWNMDETSNSQKNPNLYRWQERRNSSGVAMELSSICCGRVMDPARYFVGEIELVKHRKAYSPYHCFMT